MAKGKVIRTLRGSPLAIILSEAELRLLSNSGSFYQFNPGQTILVPDGQDERLFCLAQGRVAINLRMMTESGQCSGEASLELTSPGEIFGWAAWMRQDRLAVSAQALDQVSLVALDLHKLGDTQTFLKVNQRMLQILYGILQEYGLCPPSIQGILEMKHLLQ